MAQLMGLEQQILTTRPGQERGRQDLVAWEEATRQNLLQRNPAFRHSLKFHFGEQSPLPAEMESYASVVPNELETLVRLNDQWQSHPRLEPFDGLGRLTNEVVHHPTYEAAGDLIYGTSMLQLLDTPGRLLESLMWFYLSSHAGEAGHHCPVACTAGVIRVLKRVFDVPQRQDYLKKMMLPSFRHNFTGAQFVTEVQGGSDVGLNDVMAYQDADRNWRLRGEKWFCSNANADLFLVTGRVGDPDSGTKGLGLFLVPRLWEGNQRNTFSLRRLKEKIGTRTMASAEIDFIDTRCLPVGPVEQGFKMLMEHVLHLSRLYNSFAALGISTRSLQIAMDYAKHRKAFGRPIGHYPLVMEPLGQMLSEVLAVFAGACFAVRLQDQLDQAVQPDASQKMLMRLLANLMKYISGRWAVDHAHHSMDILAGNGTIETFSALPRLLRDSLVIENWEGTHNTLRMQIFRDLCRYDQDQLLLTWLREQLSPHSGPLCEVLKGRIAHLESSCQRFRGLSTMERSLAIKAVVDEMALVYLAVCLFQEAQHQEGQEQCAQKRLALQWFVQQHLSGEEPGLDEGQRLQLLQGLLSVPF